MNFIRPILVKSISSFKRWFRKLNDWQKAKVVLIILFWILLLISYWYDSIRKIHRESELQKINNWTSELSMLEQIDLMSSLEEKNPVKEEIKDKIKKKYLKEDFTSEKNTFIKSFSRAKAIIKKEKDLYNKTLYCWCKVDVTTWTIDTEKCGFDQKDYSDTRLRNEWEHIVPASSYWETFVEWTEWDEECVNTKWVQYKWRRCAWKNQEFAFMESDLYNLYPSIWIINALRSNKWYWIIYWEEWHFWKCDFEVNTRKVEPTEEIRWLIARTYLYMIDAYWKDRFKVPSHEMKILKSWDNKYPVTVYECKRYEQIKQIQWNENWIMKKRCDKLKSQLKYK